VRGAEEDIALVCKDATDGIEAELIPGGLVEMPHLTQNCVSGVIGEPHLVQKWRESSPSVRMVMRCAPHFMQNALASDPTAPHFSQTVLTSLLISSTWPLHSEVSR